MSIKKGTMPPRYDEAFKSGAIKMVTEQGRLQKKLPPNSVYVLKLSKHG